MLADALLRSASGTTALLRVTGTNTDTNMSEVGLVATTFADVPVSPVVMRKLRPTWQEKRRVEVGAAGVGDERGAADKHARFAVGTVSVRHNIGGYRGWPGLSD